MNQPEKAALFDTLEQVRREASSVEVEDIERLVGLFPQIRDLSETLLQEGNPYNLTAEEITILQTACSEIAEHGKQLADTIASSADVLRLQGVAASSYLKHS